ncbi:hypothetical protein BDD12DRAFT_907863 [Trichophaea hybrida]|nr:hypothetical protein BDD12DRAFT_907863 [Trichophaea hybrida]
MVGIKNGVPMGLSENLIASGFLALFETQDLEEYIMTAKGTFSIIVSDQSEYNDRDLGYELHYYGMHGEAPSITETVAQLTNGTKTLIIAMSR